MPGSESESRRRILRKLATCYGEGAYYRKRREAVVAEISRILGRIDSMLDLGWGNGAYLFNLSARLDCRRIVGADLSIAMLAELRRRAADSAKAPPILCCDLNALPFRSGSWDVVFCSHVLQFVRDGDRTVSDIARCLRPGAMLIIAGEGSGTGALESRADADERWRREFHARARTGRARDPDRYRRACENAGFKVERKSLSMNVTWSEMAEWYRIRWFPVIDESRRAEAETILRELERDRGSEVAEVHESLLFARRPA